jgi:hypothetical protein
MEDQGSAGVHWFGWGENPMIHKAVLKIPEACGAFLVLRVTNTIYNF